MKSKICNENNILQENIRVGTVFAKKGLIRGEARRNDGETGERQMSYYRYENRDEDWDTRFRRACRGREGFAWGAFLIGLVLGAIIF
ncbi:MAG: hypothetical protein KDA46_01070 [Parvularculaceae bacterium]|nr:hypothetical protein [Parvularculaceae bacterium]